MMSTLEARADLIQRIGGAGARYTLVLFFLGFGLFKFTAMEAEAIRPLMAASPFLSWLYAFLDVRQASAVIGVVEILLALMVLARPWAPRLAALGALGIAASLVVTLSFLVTTPGIDEASAGFIMKDITLLFVAVWAAGEALKAAAARRVAPASPAAEAKAAA